MIVNYTYRISLFILPKVTNSMIAIRFFPGLRPARMIKVEINLKELESVTSEPSNGININSKKKIH